MRGRVRHALLQWQSRQSNFGRDGFKGREGKRGMGSRVFLELELNVKHAKQHLGASMKAGSACRGFVVGYLLFALTLLAITVAAVSQIQGKQDTAKWLASSKDKLEEQANTILSQLSTCVIQNTSETDVDVAVAYPAGANVDVSTLTCPATEASLWSGSAGAFAPKTVSGFSSWKYYKASDSTSATVFIYVQAVDLLGKPALRGLHVRFGSEQASLSQTIATSDTLKLHILTPE